eukprot:TRINITY_DN288_c0_g1_i6.p1 TRINITY_DN288_c0_g1~~TRINITY_DN288_c0_g1_i6.p1  ORF type:complete len:1098 (-),score=245.46 TRINITY_DN288_c0_g1_i6:143-3436(-)
MLGGSERYSLGEKESKESCAKKCTAFAQSGCCEFRSAGTCIFKVDGFSIGSPVHNAAQTLMCRPAAVSLLESSAETADNSTHEVGVGRVPADTEKEVSKEWDKVSLSDFNFNKDCGEFGLNAFGWKDSNRNRKLEIFGKCAAAATVGEPVTRVAKIAGEFDVMFETKADWPMSGEATFKLTFESAAGGRREWRQKIALKAGMTLRLPVKYDGPFKKVNIYHESVPGLAVYFKFKADGREIPNLGLAASTMVPALGIAGQTISVFGNRLQFELAAARIECGKGQALTSLKLEGDKFVYKCSYMAGMGACVMGQTEQVETSSGNFDALRYHSATCPSGEVLQSLITEESTGGAWMRIRYFCCQLGGLPIALLPTGQFATTIGERKAFKEYEGIYCPSKRDASGRLTFQRATTFQNVQGTAMSLTYNRDETKWCINDLCIDSLVAHPLELQNQPDSVWQITPFNDFDGVFSDEPPPPHGPPAPRKKPALIVFGATQPEYAAECRDEVTPGQEGFDLDKMNKEGMALPEGNPCRLLAGGWEEGEGIGTSYWTTHAYASGSSVESGAGTTYDSVRGCGDREISRDLKAANWDWNTNLEGLALDKGLSIADMVCGVLPDVEVAPLGIGAEMNIGEMCSTIVDVIGDVAGFGLEQDMIWKGWGMEKDDNADCNSMQHGFSRIFCDLHCIRDAIKQGDKAILKSLEGAAMVMGQNTQLLLDYYSGTFEDTIITMQMEEQKKKEEEAKAMHLSFRDMFVEMGRTLQSGVTSTDPASKSTALRALDTFAARFSRSSSAQLGNASDLENRLLAEAEALRATVALSNTAKEKGNTAAMTAQRVASSLTHLQKVLKARQHVLGVYRTSAVEKKQRQRKLARSRAATAADAIDEVRSLAASSALVSMDKSWWSIRETLDSYLETAADQSTAYGTAFALLDGYTVGCTAGFNDLQKAYNHAQITEKAAHAQLRRTWHKVSEELGLLAAKIEDANVFAQLARLDASSVRLADVGTNKSLICSGSDADAMSAAVAALKTASKGGFVQQTVLQLRDVFSEVPMLVDRFKSGAMRSPDTAWTSKAWIRILNSFKAVEEGHKETAHEWLDRIRRTEC